MFDAHLDTSAQPVSAGNLARRRPVAGPAERAEMTRALGGCLEWLLALQRRAACGQEGSAIRAREVATEIAAVTRELAALGADPAGAQATVAGVSFASSTWPAGSLSA